MIKLHKIANLYLILHNFFDITVSLELGCGDWEVYNNQQKCFKVFDSLVNETEAEIKCSNESNSSLLTINSKSEQDFLSNLLFSKYGIVDNVWLGVKWLSNSSRWIETSDGTSIRFVNWVEGSPTNSTEKSCAQLLSDEKLIGKWLDVSCKKSNKFVCQKQQILSNSSQQTILNSIEMLTESVETVKQQLTEQQSAINKLKQSSIPVGFVYTQLPNEKSPIELWPTVSWTDISNSYAGIFFRVSGGEAAKFGELQKDNAPHLESVFYGSYKTPISAESDATFKKLSMPTNGNSSNVNGYGVRDLVFSVSGGEVRPKNMAIRIWKRLD